jgi:uncharacterized protein (DUF2267 family)
MISKKFFEKVKEKYDKMIGLKGEVIRRVIIRVLYRRVGSGEKDDIKGSKPHDIQGFFLAAKKCSKSIK